MTPADTSVPYRVCFVCTGNICRSPMAEVVFTDLTRRAGLDDRIAVDSVGTGGWHEGGPADDRTVATLRAHELDGATHRARRFRPEWFAGLDLVIALDRGHERALAALAPTAADRDKVRLLSGFDADADDVDVQDPYYHDEAAFERAYHVIERACRGLLSNLERLLPAAMPR